ncbi:hypothetical protein B9Z55_000597 [Caenorhabditis nigoni]|uniref:Uncharacterized protein n=1 Tax=Caenorhabditis nigoni TaxID=1611254 RepID=A0A2G5VUD3_9PELO|nr:hypothetical protein B9Z55_000597 [Caenorhabditis nigoni]
MNLKINQFNVIGHRRGNAGELIVQRHQHWFPPHQYYYNHVPLLQRAIEPKRVFGDEGQDPRAWPHVVPLFDPVVVDVFASEEGVLHEEVREEHVGHEEDPVMGEWLENQQLNDRGQGEEEEEVENIDLRGPRRAPIMLDQLREMIPKLVEISECAACKQIVQEGKLLHCGHCLCDPCEKTTSGNIVPNVPNRR